MFDFSRSDKKSFLAKGNFFWYLLLIKTKGFFIRTGRNSLILKFVIEKVGNFSSLILKFVIEKVGNFSSLILKFVIEKVGNFSN